MSKCHRGKIAILMRVCACVSTESAIKEAFSKIPQQNTNCIRFPTIVSPCHYFGKHKGKGKQQASLHWPLCESRPCLLCALHISAVLTPVSSTAQWGYRSGCPFIVPRVISKSRFLAFLGSTMSYQSTVS